VDHDDDDDDGDIAEPKALLPDDSSGFVVGCGVILGVDVGTHSSNEQTPSAVIWNVLKGGGRSKMEDCENGSHSILTFCPSRIGKM
jgi:hypothetical protein